MRVWSGRSEVLYTICGVIFAVWLFQQEYRSKNSINDAPTQPVRRYLVETSALGPRSNATTFFFTSFAMVGTKFIFPLWCAQGVAERKNLEPEKCVAVPNDLPLSTTVLRDFSDTRSSSSLKNTENYRLVTPKGP